MGRLAVRLGVRLRPEKEIPYQQYVSAALCPTLHVVPGKPALAQRAANVQQCVCIKTKGMQRPNRSCTMHDQSAIKSMALYVNVERIDNELAELGIGGDEAL